METCGKDILGCLAEKQIVLDGKVLKGVYPTSKGNSGLYILNACVSENNICVGQRKVEDKSNEITAIPEVLKSLDIENAIVTIGAMGTQTKIVDITCFRSKVIRRNYLKMWHVRSKPTKAITIPKIWITVMGV